MDNKLLKNLLNKPKEKDWFEFKGKLKLYLSDGTLVDLQRDELIKDILGLENGNSNIIRKTKYLIVGADDNKFDKNGLRLLYDVDYKTPSQSDLIKWLNSASSPSLVGIECELIPFQGVRLFIITIPPSFNLHETTHELITPGGKFNKFTVFMRQDEHTVPASVRDGMTIQQLKQLHRQEVANPSAIWISAITGGFVAFIIGAAKIKSMLIDVQLSELNVQIIFIILGVFFGGTVGWIGKKLNEVRYDFRYMSRKNRIITISFFLVYFAITYFLLIYKQ